MNLRTYQLSINDVANNVKKMNLNQFLKWKSWVSTGGEAKQFIKLGMVTVNGAVETCRSRHLVTGDKIVFGENETLYELDDFSTK